MAEIRRKRFSQACFRRKRKKNTYVTYVQCTIRRKNAGRLVQGRREERAAREIQRAFRGFLGRESAADREEASWAALVCQSAWRAKLAGRAVRRQRRESAALCVQRVYRGAPARLAATLAPPPVRLLCFGSAGRLPPAHPQP